MRLWYVVLTVVSLTLFSLNGFAGQCFSPEETIKSAVQEAINGEFTPKNVVIIGTGYVGLPTGAIFSKIGHNVTCIDKNKERIAPLQRGESYLYEEGLDDIMAEGIAAGRLKFSTEYDAVRSADVVFLAVGTPDRGDGTANLDYIKAAAEETAEYMKDGAIIVIKSTVPAKTHQMIVEAIDAKLAAMGVSKKFSVVNNPEFLRQGSAVHDFMNPDRVVVGYKPDHLWAALALVNIYAPILKRQNQFYAMTNTSAELVKEVANTMLAQRIATTGFVAQLCDSTGADVSEVMAGVGSDARIGPQFLQAGPGFGGSCFPKDVAALVQLAHAANVDPQIIESILVQNGQQKTYLFNKMADHYDGALAGKVFTMWGTAFKANTDDIRETPAINMVLALVRAGAIVKFMDPKADENFRQFMAAEHPETNGKIKLCKQQYGCLKGSDALIVMTEWQQFKDANLSRVVENLNAPVVFDGRNLFTHARARELGISYHSIGTRR